MIIVLLLAFVLVGCGNNPRWTLEKWALEFAVEEYNCDYKDYGILAYKVDKNQIYDKEKFEQWTDGEYLYVVYEVTLIDLSGNSKKYNVFIIYENGFLQTNYYKQERIIDVDVEEA